MRSSAPWLAALVALGGAVLATAPASATPARAPAAVAPVELISPAPSTPLAGGSTAILEWTALPGWERLPAREEWEAFLSLDGGRSYAVRITPHLDHDLRRIRWAVPDLPSGDVRLLLRFGDERRETVVELPQRFAIVAGALGPASPEGFAGFSGKRGEAARPGEAGVVAWVEGSRRGAGWRPVIAHPAALGEGQPRSGLSADRASPAAVASAAARLPAPRAAGPRAGAATAAKSPPRLSTLPPVDPLLQTGRRNE